MGDGERVGVNIKVGVGIRIVVEVLSPHGVPDSTKKLYVVFLQLIVST